MTPMIPNHRRALSDEELHTFITAEEARNQMVENKEKQKDRALWTYMKLKAEPEIMKAIQWGKSEAVLEVGTEERAAIVEEILKEKGYETRLKGDLIFLNW